MEKKTAWPLSKVRPGEKFLLGERKYIRLGELVEEEGVYCRNLLDSSSGFLSPEKMVVVLDNQED
jgi:hypothetical protein